MFTSADLIRAYSSEPINKYIMEDPTLSVIQANTVCGDEIEVFVGIQDGVIDRRSRYGDAEIQTTAAASMLAEVIVGKKLEEVMTRDYVYMKEIGLEVSPRRRRSIVTAVLATRRAIDLYRGGDGEFGYEVVL